TATFNSPMGTPALSAFTVTSAASGRLVAGQLSLSGGNTTTLTAQPSISLPAGDVIEVSLTDTLLNTVGGPLDNPKVWRYRARANAAPARFDITRDWSGNLQSRT